MILVRNLDTKNGMEHVVMNAMDHVIEVIAISVSNPCGELFIPRITLVNSSGTLPFTKRRKQFRIKSAFKMAANKTEGKTISWIGIYNYSQSWTALCCILLMWRQLLNKSSLKNQD